MSVKVFDCPVIPLNPKPTMVTVMDFERAVADDVESNAPASAQGTTPSDSRPTMSGQKIRKYEAEEFRATSEDDVEKAEFWLENTFRVFDEMSLSPGECIKCVWWKTLISVVPKEQVNWDFFQSEFRKKYISQRFIDQKRKEFLDLK
ncbi:DNA-dependent protein kinase catalytic subunit [Gossypium australe]|uniref:DNA-dependent protein kinase catalytic subunit n=1 Tax=Gossypium australe TaxID=47621 RepID=A0A5B6VX72_9ROSI|nr:DNA-dependent protein kinase catalytic subunit [Gossypium australe]